LAFAGGGGPVNLVSLGSTLSKLATYEAEAKALIDEDLARLKSLTYAEAMSLPEVSHERELTLGDIKCSATVFAQRNVHNLPGAVLVVALVARARFFGAMQSHTERGLMFLPDGTVREATNRELDDNGG